MGVWRKGSQVGVTLESLLTAKQGKIIERLQPGYRSGRGKPYRREGNSVLPVSLRQLSIFTTRHRGCAIFETIEFLKRFPFAFFTDTQWTPLFADKHFGILPLLRYVLTSTIAVLVAMPVGLLSGLSERVRLDVLRKTVKPPLRFLPGPNGDPRILCFIVCPRLCKSRFRDWPDLTRWEPASLWESRSFDGSSC
jgi:hypothetical protein